LAITFRRASPFEVREPVVELYWRMRKWPYETKEEYYRYWDWRYSSLSESDATVWIAADGDTVIGHIAMYSRHLRLDGHDVRAGVPGNFLVDERFRNSLIGPRLVDVLRRTVREGEIELLLGYGNAIAHAMFVGLGDRDIGPMQPFADVRRWDPVLARRTAGAALLAPLARAAAWARKAVLRRHLPDVAEGLVVRDLSSDEVLALDRSHWTRSESLVLCESPVLLANRFFRCPFRSHHVFGVIDERTDRLEGMVVTEGTTRIRVWECEVNEGVLSEVQAVELALGASPSAESVYVPLLPQSALADDFSQAGFVNPSDADTVLAETWWSAHWLPTHPLAAEFADLRRWKLWYAWCHH